jgi:GrpB-like predicted nucleotidyltransferase (UPF0157 family)
MQRTIIVAPYDPAWPEMFEREAAPLREVFGSRLVEIHHIGSTSIPGMHAKPIIDMMPLVHAIDAVDAVNDSMVALGHEARGEYGIPGRRYFPKGGDVDRSINVHVFAHDDPSAARHLAFRNYLRAHPKVACEYAELKLEGARLHPNDIHGYMDHKDGFIKRVALVALAWWVTTVGATPDLSSR